MTTREELLSYNEAEPFADVVQHGEKAFGAALAETHDPIAAEALARALRRLRTQIIQAALEAI